jgi:hypothetical protein
MWIALVVFASFVGLLMTAVAVFTVWYIWQQWKLEKAAGKAASIVDVAARLFMRWTYFDYAILLVFAFGVLFQLADLVAVMRDRALFPPYHLAYVWCGFIFTSMGVLFMLLRLSVVLKVTGPSSRFTLPNHHDKPDHTNHPE